MRKYLVVLVAMLLAACNPVENLNQGNEQVERFQKIYTEGNVKRLYRLTGSELREITSAEQFAEMYSIFDARLGKIVSSERVNFNSKFNNGVSTTVIVMETEFEKGSGTETFTFRGNGNDMELVGWNVNSPRLAITADDLKREDMAAE